MAELALIKTTHGLAPFGVNDREFVSGKLKLGDVIQTRFSRARNPLFHRKYMALLNLAFDHFEPASIEYKGQLISPEKNFNEFRRWVVIKAGFFNYIAYPDGAVRVRAKSISFANMEEDEFSDLYSKSIDVLLKDLLSDYETYDQVESTVNRVLEFA